ncbi:MAG TPA: glycosyltransferase family 39 protein [Clostridia bacterium]|nr:glycosyltransferase family 39 protein [Clostridia bacterium]
MRLIKKVCSKNKEGLALVFIVLLAAFLRLYRLESLTNFLGEQGRDLLIAREILKGKLTLLGPPTSISAVHFGPFYHYFNAFFLLLFGLDPLGPALGFAFLSIASCFFLYQIGRIYGYPKAGLVSALLFAVSPLMVEHGRSIFNSYFITSFTIFAFWAAGKFFYQKKPFFLFLSGLFAGIALQANFLALGAVLALGLIILGLRKHKTGVFWFVGLFLALLPYLLFELRHSFFNLKTFLALAKSGGAVSFSDFSVLIRFFSGFERAVWFSLVYNQPVWTKYLVIFLLLTGTGYFFFANPKDKFLKHNLFFLLAGLGVVSFYPGPMLVHYLGAIYPAVFLLAGYLAEKVINARLGFLSCLLVILLTIANLSKLNLSFSSALPRGWDLNGVRQAGRIISQDARGNFNVAALLDGDTRAYPYRYIIEVAGKKPLGVEEYPRADTLYVIARGEAEEVLSYPVWEINTILPARVTQIWPVKNNISVFKLERL